MREKPLKICFFSWLFSLSFFAHSQAPALEWAKCFGGSGDEQAWSAVQTKDSGFVIAGWTNSVDGNVTGEHGNYDYWLIKINGNGIIEWEKCYGGSQDDGAYSVIQTIDGGYALAGFSASDDGEVTGNHGEYDFWILKIDTVGDIQWEKSLGGSYNELAYSIIQTRDGGYAVAGIDSSFDGEVTGDHGGIDCWIAKLDSAGNLIWEKSLGGSGFDAANQIIQTADGGYAIACVTGSNDGDVTGNHGDWDYWVVKLDSIGNIIWGKCYGGSQPDYASSIIENKDGGYMVAGYSESDDSEVTNNYGNLDYWIIKIDSIGNLLWQKNYGGNNLDVAISISPIKNGYSVVGYSQSDDIDVTGNHGGLDYWVINIDSIGNLEWEESLGGSEDDYGQSIVLTNDSEYIIAGWSYSNDDEVSGNHGEEDFWIVKLGTATGVQEVKGSLPGVVIYPNPAGGYVVAKYTNYQPGMSIIIYNCLGQVAQEQPVIYSTHQIDVSHLPPGLYMVCIKQNGEVVANGKFVKE